MNVSIKLNHSMLRGLDQAAVRALEMTAEAVHTEIVLAQVMPFAADEYVEKRVYGKRGQFAKNGREYKGKVIKEKVHAGGHLQNDSTFVDTSHSAQGQVEIVSSTPYARRLYYHPEYNFNQTENPSAGAHWFDPWADGGVHEDFAGKAFAQLYKQEAGL